jgi:formylglycine-generating enzyme required for sulfatase activity
MFEATPEDTLRLREFEFTVATVEIERVGLFWRKPRVVIQHQTGHALAYREPLNDAVAIDMVSIPGGTFNMGSPEDERQRRDFENPQHQVTVSPFFMGRYPITQEQWRAVAALPQVNQELDPDPSRFQGSYRPVEQVSWNDAIEFCDRLSRLTGKDYRLPSEAEWEYACRAGTTTPFHFGMTITPELATYDWEYIYHEMKMLPWAGRRSTTPVEQFQVANAFGLCDLHGNVWEWCADHWHDHYQGAPSDGSAWMDETQFANPIHVVRGGGWDDDPRDCRSASRYDDDAEFRGDDVGFRIVCSTLVPPHDLPR